MSSSVPLPGDGQPAAVPATSRTQMRQHLETAPPEPTKIALANDDLGICHSRAPAIWTHLPALLAMAAPRINRGLGSLQHMAVWENVDWLCTCDFMEPKAPEVGDCAASHMRHLQAHEFLLHPHHWSRNYGGDSVIARVGSQHWDTVRLVRLRLHRPKRVSARRLRGLKSSLNVE